MQDPNPYLDYLMDLRFQGIYRLFVLSFENNYHQRSYKRTILPTVELRNCILLWLMDETHDLRAYHNIRKITSGQRERSQNWLSIRL